MTKLRPIERIKAAWRGFRAGGAVQQRRPSSVKAAPIIWPDFRLGMPQWKMFSYDAYVEEGFNLNTLIYSAIMYKARAMRSAPLKAWTGTPEEREPADPGHPLSKLIARPNPHQSWAEFQDQYIVYENIAGNNYTFLDRPRPGALPEAMFNLRPDRVFIVPGKVDGHYTILGYLYVPEGRSAFMRRTVIERLEALDTGSVTMLLPEDVMHVKLPNPGDTLEGMGEGLPPISPLAQSADVDNAVTHFLKLFFDHGVIAPGIISFDDPMTDPDLARFKERWKEIYGGYQRWAEEIMVTSRAKFQRVSLTFDEMGFTGIDERNETRILGPFGVPPILIGSRVGLSKATYANYQEARRAFWEDTMVPETRLFETEFQFYLLADDGVFVAFDFSNVPALKKNVPELITAARELFSMGVPVNQALIGVGLQIGDVPGGDVGYLPLNLLPIATGANGSREQDMSEAESADDDTRKLRLVKKNQQRALVSRPNSTFTNK